MAQTQSLKRRIRSIGNTKQITKAMELVAAAKMRRVQDAATSSRYYSDAAILLLRRLADSAEAKRSPYFSPAPGKLKLYIIFTSDGGLAGAYNANVFNAAARAFTEDKKQAISPQVIVFGRRGARHFARGSNIELLGEYENVADDPDMNIFAPVVETIHAGVKEARFCAVSLVFTEFRSTLSQSVRTLDLVPIQPFKNGQAESASVKQIVFEFEPDTETVLQSALKLYLESNLRRARVEAAASEHAMRMMSMNSANRNAGELIDALTLELNATRQAAITQEMAEIIGGANAIS